jgi:hypothetical protein
LVADGYFWHAERIDNWIHRLQVEQLALEREMTSEREKGGASSC